MIIKPEELGNDWFGHDDGQENELITDGEVNSTSAHYRQIYNETMKITIMLYVFESKDDCLRKYDSYNASAASVATYNGSAVSIGDECYYQENLISENKGLPIICFKRSNVLCWMQIWDSSGSNPWYSWYRNEFINIAEGQLQKMDHYLEVENDSQRAMVNVLKQVDKDIDMDKVNLAKAVLIQFGSNHH